MGEVTSASWSKAEKHKDRAGTEILCDKQILEDSVKEVREVAVGKGGEGVMVVETMSSERGCLGRAGWRSGRVSVTFHSHEGGM